MEEYGIISCNISTIYEIPKKEKETSKGQESTIVDEGLYGMGVAIEGKMINGFYPIRTCYQYREYMKAADMRLVSELEIRNWETMNLMVVNGSCVDVMSIPDVKGMRVLNLSRGAVISVENWEYVKGWAKVRLTGGQRGFIRNQYLRRKEFSQAGLWEGGLPQKAIENEEIFRQSVTETAKQYLGTQYRWGGKTSHGIDCSGLTSSSYMLNGILIYRDAKIMAGFPVHEIDIQDIKRGDLLYFPGHIAMYLKDGDYIHATGNVEESGVILGSLIPGRNGYREDLAKSLYAVGSIFGPN